MLRRPTCSRSADGPTSRFVPAHATRIVFDGTRASGVRYLAGGREQEAVAAREVILCGGAVNSPQLLLLSGAGPADHLRGLGIPVVADLPGVGQNLQDHLAMGVVYRCKEPITLASAETLGNLLRYIVLRRGPLTSNVAEAGGFVRLHSDSVSPDLQFHFGPTFYVNHGFTTYPGHAFSGGPALLHPESRGSITLRSADPLKPPAIQPNYLAAEADLATLVEGVKWTRRLLQARAFDRYRGEELHPGADAHDDAGIAAAVSASPRRSTTRSAPAAWAPTHCRSWTPSCASTASKDCGWWTPRSCRRS